MGKKNWRVECTSPVGEYFKNKNNLDVSKLIFENSADSLRIALDHYINNLPSNSNYKHTILYLDHSIETLLKSRIALEEKNLILYNKNAIELENTINIKGCIKELEKIDVILEDIFKNAILDLHIIRNDIWHFGFLGNMNNLDKLISFCSCVYWVFLMKYMPHYGIRLFLNSKQFETLMTFDKIWHIASYCAAKIMSDWQQTLDVEQERYEVKYCKECLTLSAIKDNSKGSCRCRCCGFECKS